MFQMRDLRCEMPYSTRDGMRDVSVIQVCHWR